MSSRGPTPKLPERRQRANRRGLGLVVAPLPAPQPLPEPPRGLLKPVRDQWAAFWRSPVAAAIDRDSDLAAIRRLWTLYDERERAYRGYRKCRIVAGSTGQPVANPLARVMATLDGEIRNLEDRFGLTPMSRLRLGLTLGEARRSLDELNRSLDEHDDQDDPRAA